MGWGFESPPRYSRVPEVPTQLERFVAAQDHGGAYEQALAELRAGVKRGHWIWFVFPQIAGLGFSEMSRRYGISSRDEAGAYLAHPVLGPRLIACAQALLELPGDDPAAVMGELDAVKLRSSMNSCSRVSRRPIPSSRGYSRSTSTASVTPRPGHGSSTDVGPSRSALSGCIVRATNRPLPGGPCLRD